ncbi:MAG: hypothetical protein SNG81_03340 [Rikenellaceae bacterium]
MKRYSPDPHLRLFLPLCRRGGGVYRLYIAQNEVYVNFYPRLRSSMFV